MAVLGAMSIAMRDSLISLFMVKSMAETGFACECRDALARLW